MCIDEERQGMNLYRKDVACDVRNTANPKPSEDNLDRISKEVGESSSDANSLC
jgi:hypothetical protein